MSVAVIFAGLMVLVIGTRGGQLLKPFADVLDESAFEVIDVDSGCYVHGRDKAQAVFHATAANNLFDFVGDMHHLTPLLRFKNQVLRMTLHETSRVRRTQTAVSTIILKTAVTNSRTAESLSQRGLDLLAEGRAAEAATSFRSAIAAAPENSEAQLEAHHGLVRALRDAGQLNKSVAAAMALIALAPGDPLAHTALSISLQHAGYVPEAEAAAARARVLEWKAQLQSPPGEDFLP